MSAHRCLDRPPVRASQAGRTIRTVTVPLYGLDIETDTTTDGLDPAVSAIVAVAVSTDTRDHVFTGSEPSILRHLDRLVSRLPAGLLVTWNGATFDLPFLDCRSRQVGVPLGLALVGGPVHRPAPPRRTR